MNTITSLHAHPQNNGRLYYVRGTLDCGHDCTGKLKQFSHFCEECGTVWTERSCGCPSPECPRHGINGCRVTENDVHDPRYWSLAVGDDYDCARCASIARGLKELPDLLPQTLYTRADMRFGGSIKFYGRDSTSPTGVRMIGAMPLCDEIEDEIRRLNSSCCPLSPTEGRTHA